ncbi:MAG TPA: PP0621 family protein [Myxococcota bacterium]|nr:PP0621 family protein [Myxococcota bacterium]
MARVLLLIAIAIAIYWLFRGFFRSQVDKPKPPATTAIGEDMIACARCGVNLPRSEAREEQGRLVCQNNPQCH